MNKPQTVMVLMGGWSAERDVSLTSGQAVSQALQEKGYSALPFDPPNNSKTIMTTLREKKPDVIFNALHGVGGEDGTIQKILDTCGIAYTHSDAQSSALAMDKKRTKEVVSKVGIPITEDRIVKKDDLYNGHPLPLPYVLKPIADGSSVGIYIIHCDSDLDAALPQLKDVPMMAERFINGRELTVSVFDFDKIPKALCVTELKPKTAFYDYKAKYTDGITDHILDPELPEGITEKILDYAVNAHKALQCRMLSRSDFRYNETDGIIFLETNTQPGLTKFSLVPEQANHCGISFPDLIEKCVLFAFNREKDESKEKQSYG